MLDRHVLLIAAFVVSSCSPLMAIEGPTAAGPIGGTDIRAALLPPPGVYGGTMQLGAATMEFLDGNRNTAPGLEDAKLRKAVGGPFVYFVPDVKVLGRQRRGGRHGSIRPYLRQPVRRRNRSVHDKHGRSLRGGRLGTLLRHGSAVPLFRCLSDPGGAFSARGHRRRCAARRLQFQQPAGASAQHGHQYLGRGT